MLTVADRDDLAAAGREAGAAGGPARAGPSVVSFSRQPEFQERQRRERERRAENRRRYAEAAERLLRDLGDAGFNVESMDELRQRGVGNKDAVPILLKWLPHIHYQPLKEDVIHTLSSRWAKQAAAPLIREFHRVDPEQDTGLGTIRWAIGDALERIADDSVADELIAIALDRRHGRHRAFVMVALGNLRRHRERAVQTLVELLDDEHVAPYAVMGLGKLRAWEARAEVERFAHDEQRWIRDEAKKALKKIDRQKRKD